MQNNEMYEQRKQKSEKFKPIYTPKYLKITKTFYAKTVYLPLVLANNRTFSSFVTINNANFRLFSRNRLRKITYST